MSAAKHTPGPWAFDGGSRVDALAFRKATTITNDDGTERTYMHGLVALPYGCGESGTHEGNARLIAAAPDYYAGATALLAWADELDADARAEGFGGGSVTAKRIRAALSEAHARATGDAA